MKIIYSNKGILVVEIDPANIDSALQTDAVKASLQMCGLTPDQAKQLLLSDGTVTVEEDQGSGADRKEHVIVSKVDGTDVYDIGYYPPFVKPGADEIGVQQKNAEIILGKAGLGILRIVPMEEVDGHYAPQEPQAVEIKAGTLAILPPRCNGNKWISFPAKTNPNEPSLQARYIAYPGPYSSASIKTVSLK